MRPILLSFFMLLIFVSAASATAPVALALHVGDGLYEDLDHFRTLGLWTGGLELRPISRAEFDRALRSIEASAEGAALGEGDLRRLRRLRAASEAWNLRSRPSECRARRDGFAPSRWEPFATLQFLGGPTDLDDRIDLNRRPRRDGAFILGLDAGLGRSLAAGWRWYEDYSALSAHPEDGWVDNLPPDLRGTFTDPRSRNDRAVLAWGRGAMDLRLGREDRRWGQGRRGTLFLSENSFPLDGLSFRFRSRWISGASLIAQSWRAPNPPGTGEETSEAQRLGDGYFAAHRFELHPRESWSLGIYEAVAWGGRGLDLAYANPLGFFVAMTQDIWDRAAADDKKVIGVDFRVRMAPLSFYGEWLVNRIVTLDAAEDGDEAGITSMAQLAGVSWANPFGLSGADLQIEYAHLDPEVYFHPDGDSRRSLLSEGELIGHWAGPNSDDLHLAFRFPEMRAGLFRLEFEQVRWGLIEGMKGAEFGFLGLTKAEKKWIVGEIFSERSFALFWEKRGWKTPLAGELDSILSLARIEQGGTGSDSGWQAELRLAWRWSAVFRDPS